MLIVSGPGDQVRAQTLANQLNQAGLAEARILHDDELLEPGTWRIAPRYQRIPMVLMGNVRTNKAFIQLAAKHLAPASSEFPARGEYLIQFLHAPLQRETPVIVLSASGAEGLEKGTERLLDWIKSEAGRRDRLPELPLSPGRSEGKTHWRDFPEAVYDAFWYGNARAARKAHQLLQAEVGSRSADEGLWGFRMGDHYSWERYYWALRQFLALNVADADLRREVDRRVFVNVERNVDAFAVEAWTESPEGILKGLNRHLMTAFIGMYLASDYLAHCSTLDDASLSKVKERLSNLEEKIDLMISQGISRGSTTGPGDLDVTSLLARLYWVYGSRKPLENGIFERMTGYYLASVDNLGFDIGRSPYLSARPGYQFSNTKGGDGAISLAFFGGDAGAEWLRERMAGWQEGGFGITPPPGGWWRGGRPDQAKPPARFLGAQKVELDPFYRKGYLRFTPGPHWAAYKGPATGLNNLLYFRDGFTADDASLVLEAAEFGGLKMREGSGANSIVRWTEAGSLLLFQNSQKHDAWAKSGVSTSRGKEDVRSVAARTDAICNRGNLAMSTLTLDENGGGCAWSRHVFRRRGEYFVVIDALTAHFTDDFRLTCRWRSFQPGSLDDHGNFVGRDAQNGTGFFIKPADASEGENVSGRRDGAVAPHFFVQRKSWKAAAGERTFFSNLLYANRQGDSKRYEVRAVAPGVVAVKREGGRDAVAIYGAGRFDGGGQGKIVADSFALSSASWVACHVRSLDLPGMGTFSFSRPVESVEVREGKMIIEDRQRNLATLHYSLAPSGKLHRESSSSLSGKGELLLMTGRTELAFPKASSPLKNAQQALARAWERSTPRTRSDSVQDQQEGGLSRLKQVGKLGGFLPPLSVYQDFRINVQPALTSGNAQELRDRTISRHARAGWKDVGDGVALTFEFPGLTKVNEIRLIGSGGQFPKASEWEMVLEASRDGFQKDRREVEIRCSNGSYLLENAHYTNTYHFQKLGIETEAEGNAFRLKLNPRDASAHPALSLHEVELLGKNPASEAGLELRASRGESRFVAAWQGERLLLADRQGELVWQKSFPAPVKRVDLREALGGDGVDLAVYTLDDQLYVRRADGRTRVDDFFLEGGDEAAKRLYVQTKPAAVGIVGSSRNPRIVWTPHFAVMSTPLNDPRPVLRFQGFGGKLIVPLEHLNPNWIALVGTYGDEAGGVGLVDLTGMAAREKLPVMASAAMTGYGSGNQELDRYYAAYAFDEATGPRLLTVNPGGMDAFTLPGLKRVWGSFHHSPTLASALVKHGDEATLIVGREDGFLYRYDPTTGKLLSSRYLSDGVKCIDAVGRYIIAGGRCGLLVLDRKLQELERVSRPVAALQRMGETLVVGFADGEVLLFESR
ncbi:MAG TPA: hypothetical protein VNQ90_01050 [Chthoniobacteraceae bacterium]|nr:hypothetical protein [Chthoniobacteraceae bacterium]